MIWKYFFPRNLLRYPFFYNIYFQLIRKNKGIVPDYFSAETDYYFDGYPRSGNTYFSHLLSKIFPEKRTVHHLHAVAPIKIALKRKLTCFILIRNPEDAISSNYLKYFAERGLALPDKIDDKLLSKMCTDYMKYYRYVSRQKDRIQLISFDELINNPEKIIYRISKKLGYDYEFNEVESLVKKFSETYKGDTSKLGSSKPSHLKENEKEKIKKVMETINHNLLSECKSIFEKLTVYQGVI